MLRQSLLTIAHFCEEDTLPVNAGRGDSIVLGVHASITLLAAFLNLPGWNLLRVEHNSLNLVRRKFQGTRDSAGEGLLCGNRAKGNQRER